MHVDLSPERLSYPGRGEDHAALGQCMECGFCTIKCPTFVITRDERDGPRGRVRFANEIVNEGKPATPEAIHHLDRCLSCLSCSSSCPYGVDHSGLWDAARHKIEETQARPLPQRWWRRALVYALTSPRLFAAGLGLARAAQPLKPLLPPVARRMLEQVPQARPERSVTSSPGVYPAQGERKMRVALLAGCVQQVLGAEIDSATIRVLTRHGCEVVVAAGSGCCGAVPLHMGYEEGARELARKNITAWKQAGAIDAVVMNASGCGSTVKDYARLLADDPQWSQAAREVASRTKDVTELLADLKLQFRKDRSALDVALHLPCSQQHGQGITVGPRKLLQEAGFKVQRPVENHMCCGAAGTYNLLQPEMSDQLGERKAMALEATGAVVISSGNMGCMLHLARKTQLPVLHTVQLIDWATGGNVPPGLERHPGVAT